MRKSLHILMLSTILISLVFADESSVMNYERPELLLREIEKNGPEDVVNDIPQDRWEEIFNKVKTGEPGWINVAIALMPEMSGGSGGGEALDMEGAVWIALGNAPSIVLNKIPISAHHHDVCDGRRDPLLTYEEAIREVEKNITAVKLVRNNDLILQRDKCLAKLVKQKSDLKRFFEID